MDALCKSCAGDGCDNCVWTGYRKAPVRTPVYQIYYDGRLVKEASEAQYEKCLTQKDVARWELRNRYGATLRRGYDIVY